MQNTSELRKEMNRIYTELKGRRIDASKAKAFVAISNVILKSAVAENDSNKWLGIKKQVDFLKTPEKRK